MSWKCVSKIRKLAQILMNMFFISISSYTIANLKWSVSPFINIIGSCISTSIFYYWIIIAPYWCIIRYVPKNITCCLNQSVYERKYLHSLGTLMSYSHILFSFYLFISTLGNFSEINSIVWVSRLGVFYGKFLTTIFNMF